MEETSNNQEKSLFKNSDYSRRKIVKFMGLGAAGLALSPVLAACGTSATDSSGGGTTEATSDPVADAAWEADKRLRMTAWEYQPDTIKELVAAWSDQSGVAVDVDFIPNVGYTAGIQARQQGGDQADVFYNFAYSSQKFYEEGWAADLRGLPGVDDMISEMFPSARSRHVRPDGAIVSVPYFMAVHMLQYNTEILENSGFSSTPNSLTETYDQCQKIKSDGLANPYVAYWVKEFVEEYLHVYLLAGNVTPFDENGEPVFADDSKTLEVFDWWQAMFQDGMVPRSVLTDDPGKHTTEIANGRAAFYALHHYFLRDIRETGGSASDKISQAPIVGTGGKTLQMGEVVQMGGNLTGPRREAAWDLLKTYGWKDNSGRFSTFEKWASAGTLLAPYPGFFEDDAIRAAFPAYMDVDAIRDVVENRSENPPARTLPWYQAFQAQCGDIIHSLLLGQADAKTTSDALVNAVTTAKAGGGL